ncbi:hypothetical protein Tco_0134021 [Tanacetum coccineum]
MKSRNDDTVPKVVAGSSMESDNTVPKVVAGSSKRYVEQELNQESSKRQKIGEGSEPAEESKDELSQEQLQQLMIIVPEEGMNVEALQTKYPIIAWEVYTEDSRMYMHDPLKWKLYDTCDVYHVSTERRHDIFMLVKKDYLLTRALMTLMLSNKLQVDEYSVMADELLRKIFILANKPRQKQRVQSGQVSNSLSIPHKFSSLTFSSLSASNYASWICDGRFELIVMTKDQTLKGLAHSFLLRASTTTFAFLSDMRQKHMASFMHTLLDFGTRYDVQPSVVSILAPISSNR